ncbi:MAG: NTP transferase domain-containing protein [Armatimonadota bacterium]
MSDNNNTTTKVDVLILAGANADGFAGEESLSSRAMIKVADKTMLQMVVDAFGGSENIQKIFVVGNVYADGVDEILTPQNSLIENIVYGIETLDTSNKVLISTSDIPLLTTKAVDDFISKSVPLDCDLVFPVIPKTYCQGAYPNLKRTYVKTSEGIFTGGNIMLVNPWFICKNSKIISDAYNARKHVTALARMIGMGVLVRMIFSQIFPKLLSLSLIEEKVSNILSAKAKTIVSAYPEIGEDIDKQSDLEEVRRILASAGN